MCICECVDSVSFCGVGFRTYGLTPAKQVLYHLDAPEVVFNCNIFTFEKIDIYLFRTSITMYLGRPGICYSRYVDQVGWELTEILLTAS